MQTKETSASKIAYKWISYLFVFAFIYYWVFTLASTLFRSTTFKIAPQQTFIYTTFLRQNWRLFETPRTYTRQMNFIIRDKQQLSKTDTIDMVQYFIRKKLKYAPFNNYEESQERFLSNTMNRLEKQLNEKKPLLQKEFPGNTENFYMDKALRLIEADPPESINLQNIIAFGKYILQKEKIDTAGKEYQLELVFKEIPPPNTAEQTKGQTIFTTTFRNF